MSYIEPHAACDIGTGTGTQSRGTVGTGTKICEIVPVLKFRRRTKKSRSVPLSQDSMRRKNCAVPAFNLTTEIGIKNRGTLP